MHPIEKALGYTFRDPDHLTRALTHRSHSAKHNERLEYLGDALLETISSIWIYNNRPAVPEGDLTRLRATIVKEDSLVGVARRLNLGEHLRLGSGELKTGAPPASLTPSKRSSPPCTLIATTPPAKASPLR